ncbi:MAG: FliH/SctL family protein, partial [Pseudomonadota bacterium]|nr:FliH/SctL family protein [Pseudomonadota bacterium]
EAAAVVAEARDIFLAATNALNDVAESDMFAGFATQLTDAIHSLASQRAGQEIDKSPKLFSRRIEKLAEKVARASEDLTIAFHPDDLSAIGPYLEAGSHLSEARLKVDMNLQRGDVKIDAGSIGLRDILGDRK